MMSKSFLWILLGGIIYWGVLYTFSLYFRAPSHAKLPQLAIASFSHNSVLDKTILGIKEGLLQHGYDPAKNYRLFEEDAKGDLERIEPMLTHLAVHKVKAFITLTKPVFELSKVRLKKTHVVSLYEEQDENALKNNALALKEAYHLGLKVAEQIVVQFEKKES